MASDRLPSHFTVREIDGFVLATTTPDHLIVQRLLLASLVESIKKGCMVTRRPTSRNTAGMYFGTVESDPEYMDLLVTLDALVRRPSLKTPKISRRPLPTAALDMAKKELRCTQWASYHSEYDKASTASIWYMESYLRADCVMYAVAYATYNGATTLVQMPDVALMLIGIMSRRDVTLGQRLAFWSSSSRWYQNCLSGTLCGLDRAVTIAADGDDTKRSSDGERLRVGSTTNWWIMFVYGRLNTCLLKANVPDSVVDAFIHYGFDVFCKGSSNRSPVMLSKEIDGHRLLDGTDKSRFKKGCTMKYPRVYRDVYDTAMTCRDMASKGFQQRMTAELATEISHVDHWDACCEKAMITLYNSLRWQRREVEYMEVGRFKADLMSKCNNVDALVKLCEMTEYRAEEKKKTRTVYVYLSIKRATAADVLSGLEEFCRPNTYLIAAGVDENLCPMVYLAIDRDILHVYQILSVDQYVLQAPHSADPNKRSHAVMDNMGSRWTRLSLVPLMISLRIADTRKAAVSWFNMIRKFASMKELVPSCTEDDKRIDRVLELLARRTLTLTPLSEYVSIVLPLLAISDRDDGLRMMSAPSSIALAHINNEKISSCIANATTSAWTKYECLFDWCTRPSVSSEDLKFHRGELLRRFQVVGATPVPGLPVHLSEGKDMHTPTHMGLQKSHCAMTEKEMLGTTSGGCYSVCIEHSTPTIGEVVSLALESSYCGAYTPDRMVEQCWTLAKSAPTLSTDSRHQCHSLYSYPFGCVESANGKMEYLYHDKCFIVHTPETDIARPCVVSWRLAYVRRAWYTSVKNAISRHLVVVAPPPIPEIVGTLDTPAIQHKPTQTVFSILKSTVTTTSPSSISMPPPPPPIVSKKRPLPPPVPLLVKKPDIIVFDELDIAKDTPILPTVAKRTKHTSPVTR
jgi:hypothetical protein